MIVQADGKLVVAGHADGPGADFALVRYNADGTLDAAFGGGDGIVITDLVPSNYASGTGQCVIQQADGKLVVGYGFGDFAGNVSLVRYNTDGSLDLTFGGGNGIVVTNLGLGDTDDSSYGVVQQADGKLVVVGSSTSPASSSERAAGALQP